MLRAVVMMLAGISVLALTGCGDSHDSVARAFIGELERTAEVLAKVEDEKTAEAASKQLTAIADKLDKINERADQLGTPTRSDKRAMQDKYEGKLKDAEDDIRDEMTRIRKMENYFEDIRELLDPGMSDFQDAEPKDLKWLFEDL